jgi:hypothetical protein
MPQPDRRRIVFGAASSEQTMFARKTTLAFVLLAGALGACGRGPEAENQGDVNAADGTDNASVNATEPAFEISPEGTLVPPAPGETGGLPDDRAPLDESAARDPTSVEASGATIERWGIALSEGRYGDAYRLWQFEGRQSGMSEQQFTESYRKYSEIHVLVGRPVAEGPTSVRVPVQVYGRMREGSRPFNLVGMMNLQRNDKGDPAWLISDAELQPRGTVKIVPPGGESTAAIPAAFQGRWSRSEATCGKPGDEMRLAVSADSLIFYESVGKVTAVKRLAPDRLDVRADYNGEGDRWSDVASLRLGEDGRTLTIGNVKRVRCA